MKTYKNKKAYIVATVFGLSLIIIIPSVSFADSVYTKPVKLLKSGFQLGLYKPNMSINTAHYGVITSINGPTFTLDSLLKNATTTFDVSTASTTNFKKDGTSAAVGDLIVGQHVMVRGLTETPANTISAQSVNIITHEPTKSGLKNVFSKQK